MSRERRHDASDEALRRALAVLGRPDADEPEVGAAFRAVARALPSAAPAGFVRRSMRLVREAPLAQGRRPLAEPIPIWGRAAVAGAGALAVVWAAGAWVGVSWQAVLAGLIAFVVHAEVSLFASVNTLLRIGRTLLVVSEALAGALDSPPVSVALMLTAGVGGVSLLALVRLLSREQESVSWPDRSSLV
jgi:hypothetical protein